MSGVLTPVITPFDRDLSPDRNKLVKQCQWLLSQQVGLAVFGTNSEANSLSVEEKIDLLDALIDGGIEPSRLMPGTGCCSLADSVKLTAHALKLGCAGVLMLPPFYYKDVSDAGLFASYAEVIERVGASDLNIYLYHIPPVAQVGLSVDLIERLVVAYPDTVVGIKDSSGDWENTSRMLERQWDNFATFVGSETFLLANMRAGGAGCISATANVNPAAIRELYASWESEGADERQRSLDAVRSVVAEFPMIPALKSIVGHFSGDGTWGTVRPPLVPLADNAARELMEKLDTLGFSMPGLGSG